MKKITSILLLLPALMFGQATGLVIANKPSGGAIGTAATTVDVATLFNLNQTTAGQTLTVPNLTNAAAGKIIYINDVGSATLTLSPGGFLSPGKGVVLRWTGAAWNVCGIGNASMNPTSTYIPLNTGGVYVDSWIYQVADSVKITSGKLITSANGKTFLIMDGVNDDGLYNIGPGHSSAVHVSPDGTYAEFLTDTTNSFFTLTESLAKLSYATPSGKNGSFEIDSTLTQVTTSLPLQFRGKTLDLQTNSGSNFNSSFFMDTTLTLLTVRNAHTQAYRNFKAYTTEGFNRNSELDIDTLRIKLDAANVEFTSETPSNLTWFNGSGYLKALPLGTGLSIDDDTLRVSALTDTASLSNRIDLKANIASPTFTGTVTIPTPFTLGATSVTTTGTQLNYLNTATGTTGTNTTNLVYSASPALTGSPTAPTASVADSTTKIATTAFVDAANTLDLKAANNLSDVANKITSRRNLDIQELFMVGGNQATTADTEQNITELVSGTLAANSRYFFEGYIMAQCNNTGGVKFAMTAPSGATAEFSAFAFTTGATAFLYQRHVLATLSSVAYIRLSALGLVYVSGDISIGATPGAIQFQFASGVAGQTSTIRQVGTLIKITKIQ